MGLSVTVLGCDGSYAGPGGACSGYLASDDTTHVWIDCGPGTLANLQQHVDPRKLTAIVVSHSHPDHWVELPVAHNALGYYFDRRSVPLYGTTDTRERLRVAKGGEIDEVFDWHTITDKSEFEIGSLRFRCAVTDHPVETLTGLGATGVEVMLVCISKSVWQSHPMVPVIQVSSPLPLGGEGQGEGATEISQDLDLLLTSKDIDHAAPEILGMIVRVLSRQYTPKLFAQGNTDFQMTRGLLGVSL